jgi:ankyrin repeat protein
MIKKYNEFLNEKISDKLSGFNFDEIKQQLETNKINIFKYIEVCKNNNLSLPSDEEIQKYLINLDPNYILFESCKIGLMFGVKYAIDKGVNNNEYITASLRAVVYGNYIDILNYLIKNNFDIHYDDDITFYNAVRIKRFEIVKILINYDISLKVLNDSLLISMSTKQYDVAKFLIEHGADVNYQFDNALNHVISDFNPDMIKYLIEHGADISNCEFSIYNVIDKNNVQQMEYLLNIGIIIDDDMIKYAIDGQFYDIIKIFIKYGIKFSNEVLRYISEQDDN